MTELAQKYHEAGAPLEIARGKYIGRLIDIQPLVEGRVCGIYRFPGGDSCDGPALKIE